MSLSIPNLDDRSFLDLVTEAREQIRRTDPSWTDLSVHDPGMALVEVFAYLTEVMIYRLNQVPEKSYLSFLNLLGVGRHPPAAAWADVTFTRTGSDNSAALRVPAGTRITAARGADPAPVVFTTTEPAQIDPGAAAATVRLHHCELVDGELLGTGTGQPGLTLHTAKAPLVVTTEPIDLLLGVGAAPASIPADAAAREHGGVTYEIWRPVHSFAEAGPAAKVYLIDRYTGAVTFAPALAAHRTSDPASPEAATALAAIPAAGRPIRIWYRTGGGAAGNVGTDALTSLRDPLPGVRVTNPAPAQGGRAAESLPDAVRRGPYEFFAVDRAVTARDYEILATSGSSAIARARAFTRREVITYARPGEVEVVLVPFVPDDARPDGALPQTVLRQYETEGARSLTEVALNRKGALGTSCRAGWAKYKAVSVRATVVVRPEEDGDAVGRRIHRRLYQTLSPLPTPLSAEGWPFGEPLRASNVYRLLEQAEPGVRYVDDVRFVVDEAPDHAVRALACDQYEPRIRYAGAGEVLFRSTNAGIGWEPAWRFPGEIVTQVIPAPAPVRPGIQPHPGSVVALTQRDEGARVHLSHDYGETWELLTTLGGQDAVVHDLAWLDRDGSALLLLATGSGLYELSLLPGATPDPTLVDPADADRGFYAVRSFVSPRGVAGVAVAAQTQYGVYVSTDAGRRGTFQRAGMANVDTRVLEVQYDGPATTLWVGIGEPDAAQGGQGCFTTRLFESDIRWTPLDDGWVGGTCRGLALQGSAVVAATQRAGVLRLDTHASDPSWQPVTVNCGLPQRDRSRFEPVDAITAGPGQWLAGGIKGIYRSTDAASWVVSANQATVDLVTVPENWLLCSGRHDIKVVRDDASRGD